MFILRELNKRSEYNTALGEAYHLIRRGTHNEEFKESIRVYKKQFGEIEDGEYKAIYAFIVDQKGKQIPLWNKGAEHYIMTSAGKTFANVSY